jgi:hypothetical protein
LSKTKSVVYILIAVIVLALVLPSALPYKTKSEAEADKCVVQIWEPDDASGQPVALLAYGIVVDDGNRVLTVLDYEEDTPAKLLVVSPDYGTFNATIEAIDYRTSATLLQLQDANLPVAEIGSTPSLTSNSGESVYIRGWAYSPTHRYMKCPAAAYLSDNIAPLFFSVSISQEVVKMGDGWVSEPGALITNADGKAIGLLGRYWSKLCVVLLPAGYVYLPLAINVNSALKLLTDRSHTIGPAVCVALTRLGSIDVVPGRPPLLPLNDVKNLDTAVMGSLDKLGEPLSLDDLEGYSSGLPSGFHPEEGSMLIATFTYPVELHDVDDNLLGTAKWVGIQWGRSEGKPNRLIYGSSAYAVEGVRSIEGDIADLTQLLGPVFSQLGH